MLCIPKLCTTLGYLVWKLDTAVFIEIMNNTRAGIEGKIWERSYWGANQRKSNLFLQKRPINYDINNENTNTFINVYLQNKNTMKTTQVFGTAPCVKASGT